MQVEVGDIVFLKSKNRYGVIEKITNKSRALVNYGIDFESFDLGEIIDEYIA